MIKTFVTARDRFSAQDLMSGIVRRLELGGRMVVSESKRPDLMVRGHLVTSKNVSVRVHIYSGDGAWETFKPRDSEWVADIQGQYERLGIVPTVARQRALDNALDLEYLHSEDPKPYQVGTAVWISDSSKDPWTTLRVMEAVVAELFYEFEQEWDEIQWNYPGKPHWYDGSHSIHQVYAKESGESPDSVEENMYGALLALTGRVL